MGNATHYTTLDAYQAGFLLLKNHRPELIQQGSKIVFSFPLSDQLIKDLQDYTKGGLRSEGKSFNLFCLSYRWKDYGKPEFKAINWKCFTPRLKPKPTSKKETYSFKKGKEIAQKGKTFSHPEAVGAISA